MLYIIDSKILKALRKGDLLKPRCKFAYEALSIRKNDICIFRRRVKGGFIKVEIRDKHDVYVKENIYHPNWFKLQKEVKNEK